MRYRCEAASIEGFVQQVAVNYLPAGYWFYVTGSVPAGKDPAKVDAKLLGKYGIAVPPWTRTRRKHAGFANLHYIRFEEFFLLLATHGKHTFLESERDSIRDVRETPIKFAGYSIGYRGGHSRVCIERRTFNDLKAYLIEFALRRLSKELENALWHVPFEPYAPIRRQLGIILREVNRRRKAAGLGPLSRGCIRYYRRIVRPFGSEVNNRPQVFLARR